MKRTNVTSSNLASVGYCPDTQTLEVQFKSGAVWQYADVPANEHRALMDAPSVGSHFHAHIKSRYAAEAVK